MLPTLWRASLPLEPDDVVIGGGNVKKLDALPPHSRAGDNANRVWWRVSAMGEGRC
jgi:hypothetical protein